MGTYTITAVGENVRDWNSQQGGPMKAYRVELSAPTGEKTGNVEWSRKAASPAPTVGQQVEGDIEQGQYGPKFKMAARAGGGFSRAKSPEERRSIAMQASQKVAVDIAALALQHGMKSEDVEKVVEACAARLFEQVQKAEQG